MKLLAVNERRWKPELVRTAIKEAKGGAPVELGRPELHQRAQRGGLYAVACIRGLRYVGPACLRQLLSQCGQRGIGQSQLET